MKKIICYILLLLFYHFSLVSQVLINNVGAQFNQNVQQIAATDFDNVLSFQMLNQGIDNLAVSMQVGNDNKLKINQEKEFGSTAANKAYTYQIGNSNELNLNQTGSGNVFQGFQTGNVTEIARNLELNNSIQQKSKLISSDLINDSKGMYVEGDGNVLNIKQNGTNNSVVSLQQGTNNTFSGEQTGRNISLFGYQKGSNNSVVGYKQENETDNILFDKVIQIGDNLSLNSDKAFNSYSVGNTFKQVGSNLSIQVNNTISYTNAGIEVNMTGNNTKVIIDQSYFPSPMR